MGHSNNETSIPGSRTGITTRPVMQIEGSESKTSRTGVYKRKEQNFQQSEESSERREPPAPPSLPEVNNDDGGTTGMVSLDSEGQDPAKRESHPRR